MGLYDIKFTTAYPNSNNYFYTVTLIGAFVPVAMGAETSKSKLSVYTYTGFGAQADCAFFFTVFLVKISLMVCEETMTLII